MWTEGTLHHFLSISSKPVLLWSAGGQRAHESHEAKPCREINIHMMMQSRTVQHSGKGSWKPSTFRLSHECFFLFFIFIPLEYKKRKKERKKKQNKDTLRVSYTTWKHSTRNVKQSVAPSQIHAELKACGLDCMGVLAPQTVLESFSKNLCQAPGNKRLICRTSLFVSRQTMVQTVLRLGSKRTTLPSMLLVLELYMGFSNVAWPLLFSCAEQAENSALPVLLKAQSEPQLKNGVKEERISRQNHCDTTYILSRTEI